MSGASVAGFNQTFRQEPPPSLIAASALDLITKHCEESKWKWVDGILLGGCLAYALGDYKKAQEWYKHILSIDERHVEAISNLAATSLALQQRQEAEQYWRKAVRLRPSYFEAVEHLIGLLCGENRGQEAVQIIEEVERSLKIARRGDKPRNSDTNSELSVSTISQSPSISEVSDRPVFDYEISSDGRARPVLEDHARSDLPGFGSSGYAIPGSENGRMLSLAHAKGNMCYGLGDNLGAAKAFEQAVLIAAGPQFRNISDLIRHVLSVVGYDGVERSPGGRIIPPSSDPILLHPHGALRTADLCFPPRGELPGLSYIPSDGMARKAAISTTSNSLLSLAKIFQDGMAANAPKAAAYQAAYGVRQILALYYLSLSLQPSPSTANNVGILLANVQHSAPSRHIPVSHPTPKFPIAGLVPGSGIALALAYYNYGLLLDSRHAHLYTNLGSLLKDIGQLDVAIQMYEHAVSCDGNFDIALANLGNAVKDKGRISDAIMYYRRAVKASPDFAEAVCGLANALNSVCDWNGRGGIANDGGSRDRWHVDEKGMLLDATLPGASSSGWIKRVVDLVEKQLADGEDWGRGTIDEQFLSDLTRPALLGDGSSSAITNTLLRWKQQKWEGARVVRLVERATRRIAWQWYQDRRFNAQRPAGYYKRPQLPSALTIPAAPTVLPFHTFTCPMSAKQIRLISQRNGLRISCSTLKSPWLPANVYAPPPPPVNGLLHVGYVSSDFNNHPLAHLMQSVFGLHNPQRVKAFCYATTSSDGSVHRQQIEREAPVFYDANNWTAQRLVNQIVEDKIHILINLNGYTRGARNEVFAARPAPIQMSFMGFAGTLGAEWCDYLLADDTAVPPDTLRKCRSNVSLQDTLTDDNSGGTDDNWIYGENIIYCRDTFFCCDHRQSAPDSQGRQLNWEEEQQRRWAMRKEIFPHLPDDAIILGNFNQLYKV
jgi:tetratricopeptide (TPR) repeat protein